MARTRFERFLEHELEKNADAVFRIQLGDSHQHAKIVGIKMGLQIALEGYRKELTTDYDEAA